MEEESKSRSRNKVASRDQSMILFHEVTVIWRKLENGPLRKAFNRRASFTCQRTETRGLVPDIPRCLCDGRMGRQCCCRCQIIAHRTAMLEHPHWRPDRFLPVTENRELRRVEILLFPLLPSASPSLHPPIGKWKKYLSKSKYYMFVHSVV